jgi:hypothetical protein
MKFILKLFLVLSLVSCKKDILVEDNQPVAPTKIYVEVDGFLSSFNVYLNLQRIHQLNVLTDINHEETLYKVGDKFKVVGWCFTPHVERDYFSIVKIYIDGTLVDSIRVNADEARGLAWEYTKVK